MTLEPLRLDYLNLQDAKIHRNLTEDQLIEKTLKNNMGRLANNGALMVDTGRFTGRSPQDRFIVRDPATEDSIHWGNINIPFHSENFDSLQRKMITYLEEKEIFVRDVLACAEKQYEMKIRVVNELPWQNLFVRNMFIEPTHDQLRHFIPDWHVIAAPGFKAEPQIDGTRGENFSVISFEKQMILIGGTGYTGEIKKGIFSVLNYILPKREGVLPMHCSANTGKEGDTAVFFGLSGTGKTTLSADPQRQLIGDDEHGWSEQSVFNFEGGCYAKTIRLNKENEPQIFNAIKKGALIENMRLKPGTNELNFDDDSVTPNIRVSYPLSHITGAKIPSKGPVPKNIFMLTYDAFGVLPPISLLTKGQAMYQFISGFTSKVAGTEDGVEEPEGTFSACYGEPFMPLHPMEYANLLGEKLQKSDTTVWLVNTGLTGGGYGVGKRISLKYTRLLIQSALNGTLQNQPMEKLPVFGFQVPRRCKGVPSKLLNPRAQWKDKTAYDDQLDYLAEAFQRNFEQFTDRASDQILQAAPQLVQSV